MKQAKIIILAGQSNMVGVGHLKCLPKHFSPEKIKEYYDGYPSIQINYFSHDKKSDGFVKTTVGCTEISKDTLGPEVGMAEYFTQKYPGEEIFFVKCAFGGSNLFNDWMSPSSGGRYDAEAYYDNRVCAPEGAEAYIRAGWCYNELIKILGESIQILKDKGYEPIVKAFCWMQGEGDADIMPHVEEYERKYSNLISDMLSEFGEYFEGCVYVDGGISDMWALYNEINQIKQLHAQNNRNSFYVDTIGAGLTTAYEPEEEPDTAHYDCDCVIKLGRLFAEKIEL
ncbi:MAG: sialate O-acetylesterase [Ruminococcaceae bacterium]|nr:sialate O-acetylesterase [Oscillospiraceae bacterium]